ncbi:MAG: UDP-N-acetyl-D-glucosamine 6-dehydrogenase [candidate division BRC1 bacterium ADurb.BinA292]|nr:MAG: UDP-N-acetyl-D-glucosamine 6-dehydrogenase [candidate division BRC1 bacterium ADurb.BinA292]
MSSPRRPDVAALQSRIENREATVGIVGLGYVGLPLVLAFCRQGLRTIGFDILADRCRQLLAGESYIRHIASAEIAEQVATGRLDATDDFARVAETDALLICVPTPLTRHRDPDLSYITATGRAIAPHLTPGCLVCLESTTYPGTTDEELRPILEASGGKAGIDFFLAYSPEREDPGTAEHSAARIPKVVGADDPASLALAMALYSHVVPRVVPVRDTRTAEAVKLTENIFRSVNIALVNELKVIFTRMGINVWDVIDAAKTKPFGYMPFYPGPGLGGHCIPIDPFYLTWKAREYEVNTRFIELAGEINSQMPEYVVERLAHALNDQGKPLRGSRILLLGVAYKNDVDDDRESPSYRLFELLLKARAEVEYYDPYIPVIRPTREFPHLAGRESIVWSPETLAGFDAALIATAHTPVDYAELVRHCPLVVDTRNATRDVTEGREKIVPA